ncbi:MAG: nitrite/sulfite reductase [Maricaulaceae bacterium]
MYRYDEFDREVVQSRVNQFRGQVDRRLKGAITEDQFKPLRLQNGLYLQLHAYMLRVAVPYGTLNSDQFRQLAMIADKYDRGYGHVTTRQNIQFNWPELTDVPDILQDLADVQMHCFQTSGNCIRNVTSDPYAGAAGDEIEDPRPTAELLRQWSTMHPEFAFLPRKFKIAVVASPNDRAVIKAHDIGIEIKANEAGETGFHIIVGGGLGRTPIIGQTLHPFLPREELLPYLEAVMRVYNRYGRRDNKYKARIKILVKETGIDTFRDQVEAEYATLTPSDIAVSQDEVDRITAYFNPPKFEDLPQTSKTLTKHISEDTDFADWVEINITPHKAQGYSIVNISLKPLDKAPGDITSDQMRAVAGFADQYSLGELRTTHSQNIVLPHVKQDDLYALYNALKAEKLHDANIGLISDIICCPGMDYCALATARSIPLSLAIAQRFKEPTRQKTIGEMQIKISGCINACGHHHVGHIGILGLEKAGVEFYQVKLGGDATETAAVGDITGPGFSQEELIDGIERMVEFYLNHKEDGERFIDSYRRLGLPKFKEVLYNAA